MADMLKFFKGLEAGLPASGVNGAIYITTDEGGIYLGTGTGMKRLGDFVQVADVASLPAKAHENCLYYCVAENILAKWNGAEWKQVNKQPTTEELKTLLGLGDMAYVSKVSEANLSAELAEKVNASAEGNHSHANKTVLDGITAEKVAAWDSAEADAIAHADGLNTAMNTRVEALEAVDHTHTNKALLDTYTQTEENLADAVAKKHEHSNKTELDKVAAGDVAKWNAVVADHLVAADKTALEDSIGDVSTALGEEVTRAKAAEKANADAITAIKDGAAVDSFADVEAELAKKVDKVEGKSLIADTEIARLAGMSDGANKVEKSETNGNIKVDGQEVVVYTHPEKHAIADVTGLQDALDGKQAAGNYSVEGHKHVKADITDFAHTHVASEITDLDATIKGYDYATKDEAKGYADAKDEAIKAAKDAADKAQGEVDALELVVADKAAQADLEALQTYVGTIPETAEATNIVAYVQEKTAGIATDTALEELTGRVKTAEDAIDAIEADYLKAADKTELSEAIAAEKERAEGIESGLRTDVDAIKADYLKAADKEALQDQINTIMNNPDAEGAINSINEFTKYVEDHGTIADGFRADIDQNKEDIAAINNAETGILKQAKDYADGLAGNYAAAEHDHVVADITDFESAVATKVESYGYATTGYADGKAAAAQSAAEATAAGALATARTEITAEIDADVKALADGQVKTNTEAIATKANAADVYAKTETYTQEEVDAAIAAAVEAAHTWGSF